MSESCARTLCGWTGKLPGQCRGTADEILAGAARQGMDLRDLAALAAEIQSRACPDPGDDDPGKTFEDRAFRLETTFGGARVLSGDLTPECTALVVIWSNWAWRGCDLRPRIVDMSMRNALPPDTEQRAAATRGLAQVTWVTPLRVRRRYPLQITVSTTRLKARQLRDRRPKTGSR
jgi:hypothetical protein